MERIEFIVKSHLSTALYQTKINNMNKFFSIHSMKFHNTYDGHNRKFYRFSRNSKQ